MGLRWQFEIQQFAWALALCPASRLCPYKSENLLVALRVSTWSERHPFPRMTWAAACDRRELASRNQSAKVVRPITKTFESGSAWKLLGASYESAGLCSQ